MTKPPYWDAATRALAERDAVLARLIAAYPRIHLTSRGDPFTTLARAIVGQQNSVKAAQTIWDRLAKACASADGGLDHQQGDGLPSADHARHLDDHVQLDERRHDQQHEQHEHGRQATGEPGEGGPASDSPPSGRDPTIGPRILPTAGSSPVDAGRGGNGGCVRRRLGSRAGGEAGEAAVPGGTDGGEPGGRVREAGRLEAVALLSPDLLRGDEPGRREHLEVLHDGLAADGPVGRQGRGGHAVAARGADCGEELPPGGVTERVEDAKASLANVRDEALAYRMTMEELAGININDAVVRTFLDEFIPIPEAASERTRNNRAERQATFMKLWTDSPTIAPLPDSAYKLAQAAGEYLDHIRPFRNADTYLSRTMLNAEPIKGASIKLIRDLAAALVPA